MKTLYIDCSMGAAGDMLTAALLELFDDKEETLRILNGLDIPGVVYEAEKSEKCGITGTHMHVLVHGEEEGEHMHSHDHAHEHHDHDHDHEHHHHHNDLHGISHIVNDHMNLDDATKKDIMDVYGLIAEAESHAHGMPVDEIHFHEVGTMDAIADVSAVCTLLRMLKVEKVIASPVHVGAGTVHCAHGILPVPAPATAYILRDVPIYGGKIQSELCTPTGAALLKHYVSSFGDMPVMKVQKIGYGMGKKDFAQANCVRVLLGEMDDATDIVSELMCNIDDMTGEQLGFAMNALMEAGALEVFTTSIGMKKSRPGILLSVMCQTSDKDKMIPLIFKHTTTLGVRENICHRYTMNRSMETVETEFGPVRKKISTGYGARQEKLEFEDLAKIATENGLSLQEVKQKISN